MLAMAGNQADSSQIKRLEAALLQSKNEIQNLHAKIEELKKRRCILYLSRATRILVRKRF